MVPPYHTLPGSIEMPVVQVEAMKRYLVPGILDQVLQVYSPVIEGEQMPDGLENLAAFLQYIGFPQSSQLLVQSLMDQRSIPVMLEASAPLRSLCGGWLTEHHPGLFLWLCPH